MTRSGAFENTSSVGFATFNATATDADDYQPVFGRLIFSPGEISNSIMVPVNGDTLFESTETFNVVLNNPSGAILVNSTAIGTIINDDSFPTPTPTVTPSPSPVPTVFITGRVLSPTGLGVRNAVVTLTDSLGQRQMVTTSSFGVFTFENLTAGETYVIGISSKRFRFPSRSLAVNNNLTDIDFVGLE